MLILLEEEIDGISKVKVMASVIQKEQLYRDTEKECQLFWNCKTGYAAQINLAQ